MNRLLILPVLALAAAACADGVPEPTGAPTGAAKTIEGLLFVEISPGSFTMGAKEPGPKELIRWPELSKPSHLVTIGQPIWVATTEVPNVLYEKFDPNHKRSKFNRGDRDPAMWMTHDRAKEFFEWLTKNHPGTFRLPSESEC